jgi:hypothetical protein
LNVVDRSTSFVSRTLFAQDDVGTGFTSKYVGWKMQGCRLSVMPGFQSAESQHGGTNRTLRDAKATAKTHHAITAE